MPVYVDLHYGQLAHDLFTNSISITGPVLGPFLGVRLYRDEIRVTTPVHEFALQRIGDWIYYGSTLMRTQKCSLKKLSVTAEAAGGWSSIRLLPN